MVRLKAESCDSQRFFHVNVQRRLTRQHNNQRMMMVRCRMQWLFELKRDSSPKHIVYSCEHPRDAKVYWLRIETFLDPHKIAHIETTVDADSLTVLTDNIRQFSLDLTAAPLRRGQKLTVDGSLLNYTFDADKKRLTIIKNASWQTASARPHTTAGRRAYGARAAANLFQGEPLLVVYGTGADSKGNQFLRQAASILARSGGPQFKPANVRFPVEADSELDNLPLDKYNLLLVGSPETNSYLHKIASKLPY